LQDLSGHSERVAVIRSAIGLYGFYLEKATKGENIYVKDKDGEFIEFIIDDGSATAAILKGRKEDNQDE
jgi:hypothetical protein